MPIEEQETGQWAIVGGGSRGFGLVIAQQLASRHYKIAIVGRDRQQLQTVTSQLMTMGAAAVEAFAVDLADVNEPHGEDQMKFRDFCQSHAISLCVAAVGKSDRGYLETLATTDLQAAFQTNVVSSLQLIQWALPGLRKAKGQVVVIASLAGVISISGLGAYAITKSGQVALARQLRQEQKDIGVTLLCCGPIAREDAGTRYDSQASQHDLPEHLKAPGAGVKLKGLDPNRLAERLLKAAAQRKKELIVPWKARLLIAISAFFPSLAEQIINKLYTKR